MINLETSPVPLWTTTRCHRVLRPLSSKLHSLRTLVESHPSLAASHDLSRFSQIDVNARQSGVMTGVTRKYSAKSHQHHSKPSGPTASHIDQTDYSTDTMMIALRSKVPTDIYICYRSIFQAFHHFLAHAYEQPRTLAQKSGIEVGKCVVYTMGSVSEDDWYDGVGALKYYKRFIAIGHGVSLVARDAAICDNLLPILIIDCSDLGAYDMGLFLLRSLLEATSGDAILNQFELFTKLCDAVKSSPLLLLQYLVPNLTVAQITHENFQAIFGLLLQSPIYNSFATDPALPDIICSIFALCRREIKHTSDANFAAVDSALIMLICTLCCFFELDLTKRLLKVVRPARKKFTIVWQVLCTYAASFDYINAEFINSEPRLHAQLRDALGIIFAGDFEKLKACVESLLPHVPQFAASTAAAFTNRASNLAWRDYITSRSLELYGEDSSWKYDKSVDEWVEATPLNTGRTEFLIEQEEDDDDSEDGYVLESSEEKVKRNVVGTSKAVSALSNLLDVLPPPSSVRKLTPQSAIRVREIHFKLLSTPATAVSAKRAWDYATSDDEYDEPIEDDVTFSPLQGRKPATKQVRETQYAEHEEDELRSLRLEYGSLRELNVNRRYTRAGKKFKATLGESDDGYDELCAF
ncbi:hypothetical protein V1512DRAFT_252267 [Lipomyces arxii]|uniref:uncharacterized protein n=1 Tax=Lipomyces arxii TaxID=56418 RepID=UPI0034CDAEAA